MGMILEFKTYPENVPEANDLCICDAPEFTDDRFIIARFNGIKFYLDSEIDVKIDDYIEKYAIIKLSV